MFQVGVPAPISIRIAPISSEIGARRLPKYLILLSIVHKRRHVITVPSIAFNRMAWCQPFTTFVEELSDQGACHRTVRIAGGANTMQSQEFLSLLPYLGGDDRPMLSWVSCRLVSNFTDIDGIAQQGVERTSRERLGTRSRAVAPFAKFGARAGGVEFFLEQPHAAEFAVPLENASHHSRFRFNNH